MNVEQGAALGVYACLPGLILDGTLYAFHSGRYSGLDASASGTLSAGLLFAYAAALFATTYAARRIAAVRRNLYR